MADDTLHVSDPSALLRFSQDLGTFTRHARETLDAIAIELRKTQAILAEREAEWSRIADDRRAAMEYAEDEEREDAAYALEQAEDALRQVEHWQWQLDEEAHPYQLAAQAVRSLLEAETPKAQAALQEHVNLLWDYLREPPPDGGWSGTSFGSSDAGSSAPPSHPDRTPVSGFERSPLVDDGSVQRYLLDQIPAAHRNPETLRDIRYQDEYVIEGADVLLGYTTPDPSGFASIAILRHSEDGSASAAWMRTTLAHEIGHHVHLYVLNPSDWNQWADFYKRSSPGEFVSDYARKTAEEDFSESYAWYIHNPDDLRERAPKKYAFMRDSVFGGREYT